MRTAVYQFKRETVLTSCGIPSRQEEGRDKELLIPTNKKGAVLHTHIYMSKWWVKDDTTDAKMTEGDGPRGG